MTRRVRASRALGIAVLGWLALVVGGSPAPAATTPSPSGTATTPAATGAPSPGGTATPTPTDSAAATAPAPTDSATAPAPTTSSTTGALHEVDVGGVLFVSGVRTVYHGSWDPLGGTLHVELTVRNASTQVVDASASIGATTLLGIDLGGADSIAVRGLNPGEIRTIRATIGGIGQWGALRAHVTVTPPATMAGVALSPLARDTWVVVPPWYLLVLVVAAVVLGWVFRHYRLVLGPRRGRRRRGRRRAPRATFLGTPPPGTPALGTPPPGTPALGTPLPGAAP